MKHYELSLLDPYDYTGMACHFEKRAQQGWLLEKCGVLLTRYRKIEPQRIKFAVTYFPEITGYEPSVLEGNLRMREYCARAGWTLADDRGIFQIYYHEDPDAVELETEPLIKLQSIRKTMRKQLLLPCLMLAVVAVLAIGALLWVYSRDQDPLSGGLIEHLSGYDWFILPLCCVGLVLGLWKTGRYLLWLYRAHRRAREGLMTPSHSTAAHWNFAVGLLLAVFLLLSVLNGIFSGQRRWLDPSAGGAMLALPVTALFSRSLRKKGTDAKTNRWVSFLLAAVLAVVFTLVLLRLPIDTIEPERETGSYCYQKVVYQYDRDPVPLTLADLGYEGDPYPSSRRIRQRSPLVTRTYCLLQPSKLAQDLPRVEYVVADVHLPLLTERCLRDLLKENHIPAEAAPWGADRAWQITDNRTPIYVLQKERRLVYLVLKAEASPDQKAAVGEHLLEAR